MSFIDTVNQTIATIGDITKKSFGPLAPLETIVGANVYRYPLDLGDSSRYPHSIEFQTWLPQQVPITELGLVRQIKNTSIDAINAANKLGGLGADILSGLGIDGATGRNLIGSDIQKAVDTTSTYSADMMKVDRNQSLNDRMIDFTRRATRSDMIAMYMPQGSWADRQQNSYNQQSLTSAIGNIGAVLEVASSIAKSDGPTTWDMLNGPAGMEVASTVAGRFGMDSGVLRDAGLNAMGYALNPQFEMLYNGTDLREFQFDFNMTPRSQKEALMILDIIKKFKYHAAPAFIAGQGRYIVPPSYFDITFKFNGADSKWLPQISTCVLKSFDIDYTGGLEQWATHSDGSPIQIKMVLVFAELEMMHKALRAEGY